MEKLIGLLMKRALEMAQANGKYSEKVEMEVSDGIEYALRSKG